VYKASISPHAFYVTILRRHSSKRGEGLIANNLQMVNYKREKAGSKELLFHAILPSLRVIKAKYTRSWPSQIQQTSNYFSASYSSLLEDSGHQAGCDGSATFTDVEALTDFEGDGVPDLALHFDVVAWHDHL
jgi:hypothetical protein